MNRKPAALASFYQFHVRHDVKVGEVMQGDPGVGPGLCGDGFPPVLASRDEEEPADTAGGEARARTPAAPAGEVQRSARATLNTRSRACRRATQSTCGQSSSPRSWKH